jgi:simple sugar transport system permease protein
MKKNFFKTYEFFLVLLLIALYAVIGIINPSFFSVGTFLDALRIQEIFLILALGLLPVVILGGVDISYVAIAAATTYPVHMWLIETSYTGGLWGYLALSVTFGILIGLFIGWLVHTYRLKIFDVSLGMNTLLYGWVTFFIGSLTNFDFDTTGLAYWNNAFILEVEAPVIGSSGLHVSVLYIIAIGIALHLFLNYTTLGRGIYAVGSDRSVAVRTGFNIRRIYLVVFAIMGGLSGFAGVVFGGLNINFAPVMLIGKNMQVLAAVVLGGASTRGGKGSVFGVFIGTILIGLINQALVYVNVSTKWYDAVIGAMFVLYATFQSSTEKSRES